MQENAELTDAAIFEDVSRIIGVALEELHSVNPESTGLMQSAFGMVLKKIMN